MLIMKVYIFLLAIILELQHSLADDNLKVFTKTKDYIHACYYTSSSTALCVKGRGGFVEVTKNRRVLLRQEKKGHFTFQQFREKTFAKYETSQMNKMFATDNNQVLKNGYGLASMREANRNEFQETTKNLIQSEDIKLLEEMAHALGDQGIYGNVYPSVLPFYILVNRLSTMAQTLNNPAPPALTKRLVETLVFNSNSTCPPNPDEDCFGMCGKSCSCWSFVCGDCCFHKGCFEHDMCCHKDFFSMDCFNVMGLSCDSGFPKYPKCLEEV